MLAVDAMAAHRVVPDRTVHPCTPTVSLALLANSVRIIFCGLNISNRAEFLPDAIAGALKVRDGISSQSPTNCASPPLNKCPVTKAGRTLAICVAGVTPWLAERVGFDRIHRKGGAAEIDYHSRPAPR